MSLFLSLSRTSLGQHRQNILSKIESLKKKKIKRQSGQGGYAGMFSIKGVVQTFSTLCILFSTIEQF